MGSCVPRSWAGVIADGEAEGRSEGMQKVALRATCAAGFVDDQLISAGYCAIAISRGSSAIRLSLSPVELVTIMVISQNVVCAPTTATRCQAAGNSPVVRKA